MSISLEEQQVGTFCGEDVVSVKLRIETQSSKSQSGQDGTSSKAGKADRFRDGIVDETTFSSVVHPVHPVRVLVNKVSVRRALLPVCVLDNIVCVVVSMIVWVSYKS